MKLNSLYLLIAFALFSIPLVGLLALSLQSTFISVFFCLLLIVSSCFLFKKKFPSPYNTNKFVLFVGGAGLIFYTIASAIMIGLNPFYNFLLLPPTFALLTYIIAVFLTNRLSLFTYFGLFTALILFYTFVLYPVGSTSIPNATEKEHSDLLGLNLNDLVLRDCNNVSLEQKLDKKIILIENWNEYCGVCISAMSDLHPWLKEMEKQYKHDFIHLYMYNQPGIQSRFLKVEEACQFEKIPYEDMNIVISDNNSPLLKTAPKFLFVDKNGKIVDIMVGYDKRFIRTYKSRIKKRLLRLIG